MTLFTSSVFIEGAFTLYILLCQNIHIISKYLAETSLHTSNHMGTGQTQQKQQVSNEQHMYCMQS